MYLNANQIEYVFDDDTGCAVIGLKTGKEFEVLETSEQVVKAESI